MKKVINATGVVFEDTSGEILVLHRHADKPEGNTWGLAGGKIDTGEDSLQAAVREVGEEIGYNLDPNTLVLEKTYTWDYDDASVRFYVFRCRNNKNDITIQLNTTENTEYKWTLPSLLHRQPDLMAGLYLILEDIYKV